MIRLRIEEILRSKGISKTQFADMCGIQKQNVNALLDTSNIKKLQEIANVLGVKLTDLITENTTECASINGYIEFNGEVYTVKCVDDLNNLVAIVNSKQ
jgi:DNA-binding Xre family transcriptional regulator